ncbi:MAG: metallophosphatase domain-containing protein [Bacteroidales bacterium]|nr:metallophosphatase domain-containing protein [Bacteroidales bacterium]MDD4683697.1 metallophosphatase domain-containing protein [Bacteroidales bacterium]
MRILHISDTHNKHRQVKNLPSADLIIHSGDVSFAGTEDELINFIDWFRSLDYKYKIFIGGNHDFYLEETKKETIQSLLPNNCYYLDKSEITIENINFFGLPFFVSESMSGDYEQSIKLIPKDTNILITHRPPYGILDYSGTINYGCQDLLKAISKIKPRYNLFGHIHDAYGVKETPHTTFANTALVDEHYHLINKPFVFDYK